MGTQAPEVPTIQVTTDYLQFKLMAGNRPIDYNHVKRLKRSMQADPHLFPSNPIQVNEHMYIIDGQHRRLAAQELGVPVYYIVSKGATLDETRVLNVTQRRWTLLDFAKSYADSGRQDYMDFLRIHEQYPKIAPSILRVYLAGGQRHQLDVDFRRGEFQINDLEQAKRNIEKLNDVITKTHTPINTPMANALLDLMTNNEDFNFERFMQKLDRESARELYKPGSSIKSCLRSIEDVYNFQSKAMTRLYG